MKIKKCDSEIKDIEEDIARLCGQRELKVRIRLFVYLSLSMSIASTWLGSAGRDMQH